MAGHRPPAARILTWYHQGRMFRHAVRIWLLAAWASLALLLTPVIAAPVVDIRSHAKLELGTVRRQGDQLVVSGRLFDPVTLQGLPDNAVDLTIAGVSVRGQTDADGRFTVEVPAPAPADGSAAETVEAEFSGNDSLDAATLREQVNPTLAPVELTLRAQPTATGLELQVEVMSDGVPFDAPLRILADRVGSEALAPLGTTETGKPFPITRKQLGGAGLRHFRAEYDGDALHQPASATGTYELTSASVATLKLSQQQIAFEDTVTASGAVTDEDGIGLPDAAVTLVAGDRRLAQGVTGKGGQFRFRVEGEILGTGQISLQLLAEPGGSIQSSKSAMVMVKVAPPQPVPVIYTIIAFLATGLTAGAFFAARSKPWRRFAKATPPAQQPSQAAETQHGGLVVARPSLVSTLRRASDTGFSGVVRDTVRGRPVPGAMVVLLPAGQAARPPEEAADRTVSEHRTLSGEDGTFALEDLPAGEWTATVTALSHLTERFPIAVPHRGELRGVRVDLVPVREKVFLLYQRAAMPVLPDPKLWGVWSPRQIVDHVRGSRPSPALATLTDFVEEVYFSARPTEEAVIPTARQRVDAALAERAEAGELPAPVVAKAAAAKPGAKRLQR